MSEEWVPESQQREPTLALLAYVFPHRMGIHQKLLE